MVELDFHTSDQVIDALVHLVNGPDVVLVFGIELVLEVVDQLLLVLDDLLAGGLLGLNVLRSETVNNMNGKIQTGRETRYLNYETSRLSSVTTPSTD